MSASLTWIAVGLLLVLFEFVIPGFIIFFFGIGAILTGLLKFLIPMELDVQIILFAVLSVILLFGLRRFFPKVFRGENARSGPLPPDTEDCTGQSARVAEPIAPGHAGKVEFQGSLWNAESDSAHGPGETVTVVRRDNITLIVR